MIWIVLLILGACVASAAFGHVEATDGRDNRGNLSGAWVLSFAVAVVCFMLILPAYDRMRDVETCASYCESKDAIRYDGTIRGEGLRPVPTDYTPTCRCVVVLPPVGGP